MTVPDRITRPFERDPCSRDGKGVWEPCEPGVGEETVHRRERS